jgi:hypothetical protein
VVAAPVRAGPPDVIYRRPPHGSWDFIGRANFLRAGARQRRRWTSLLGCRSVAVTRSVGGHGRGASRIGARGVGRAARGVGSTFLGSFVEYELQADSQVILAIDGEWMSRGLHAPGEVIAWSIVPERAYALPA